MAFIGKTLAQATPGLVLTDLYTTPASTTSTVSIMICNTGIFSETYRVAVAPAAAADSLRQYIAYDVVISPNGTDSILGIQTRAGDVIRVYASDAAVAFNAVGTEGNG